jgi:hypothetical protein
MKTSFIIAIFLVFNFICFSQKKYGNKINKTEIDYINDTICRFIHPNIIDDNDSLIPPTQIIISCPGPGANDFDGPYLVVEENSTFQGGNIYIFKLYVEKNFIYPNDLK